MCGIFFWINKNGNVDPARARDALMTMEHRGPDFQRLLLWDGQKSALTPYENFADGPEQNGCFAAVGHARLSIIDLSPEANQPMPGPGGTVLSFNGTIYNYIELREEFEKEGETFRTSSDTEVLLKWLTRHGLTRNTDLNGSWAFGFFDPDRKTLAFSRDPYGERPLYYYSDGDDFIAASEIKAIYRALGNPVRAFDPRQLIAFIGYRNWPTAEPGKTLYHDIHQLAPGESLFFDLKTHTFESKHTNPVEAYLKPHPDAGTITQDIKRAVTWRLRCDVPIAVTVSGGVDSSAVASLIDLGGDTAKRITFYTAKFPSGVSTDLPYARTVADDLGIELKEVDIPCGGEAVETLYRLSKLFDMPVPFGGSTFSTFYLYQAISADGNKVVLNGTGGDEVFAGYGNEYIEGAINELLSQMKFIRALTFAMEAVKQGWTSYKALALMAFKKLTFRPRSNLPLKNFVRHIKPAFRQAAELANGLYWGRYAYRQSLTEVQLSDNVRGRLLNYVTFSDLCTMTNSIEGRSPFLDPEIIKYTGLPVRDKFFKGFNKYALRAAMPETVSKSVTWRRSKQGFTYPFDMFFKNNRKTIIEKITSSDLLRELFDMDSLLAAMKGFVLERDIIMHMYSVAVFAEIYPCKLAPAE